MNYMIEWTIRTAGRTHDQNLADREALLRTFGKWTPEDGLTIHEFLANLDNGGYVLVGASDPHVVGSFVSKWVPRIDPHVVPVADSAEAVGYVAESLAWDRAALSDRARARRPARCATVPNPHAPCHGTATIARGGTTASTRRTSSPRSRPIEPVGRIRAHQLIKGHPHVEPR